MGDSAEKGERWPFVDGGLVGSFGDCRGLTLLALSFWSLACVLGLRLRARARFSRLLSEEGLSGSESSEIGVGELRRFATERVTGAK